MDSAFTPLSWFAVSLHPLGTSVMGAFKGFYDDTGKEHDPKHKVCGFAGRLGTIDQWNTLEIAWADVLQDFHIPYLHMKDFSHSVPPFDKLATSERPLLIEQLCKAVATAGVKGIAVAVVKEDLVAFKKETGVKVDGTAFCMSMVILKSYWYREDKIVEGVFDWFERPHKTADIAFGYLRHLPDANDLHNFVSMHPSRPGQWKETPALQLADFLAYETFETSQPYVEWDRSSSAEDLLDWLKFIKTKHPKRTHWSGDRQSAIKLSDAVSLDSGLLNLNLLKTLHYQNGGRWC
jgi:hypothetical protein